MPVYSIMRPGWDLVGNCRNLSAYGMMSVWNLMRLLLVLDFLRISAQYKKSDETFHCPGPLPFVKDDDLPEFNPSKYMKMEKEDFIPYRVLFVYDPNMSEENRIALEKAGHSVNRRLSAAISGRKLTEMRRARRYGGTGKI